MATYESLMYHHPLIPVAFYCAVGCQKESWHSGHKKVCKTLKKERESYKSDKKHGVESAQERAQRTGTMEMRIVNDHPAGAGPQGWTSAPGAYM